MTSTSEAFAVLRSALRERLTAERRAWLDDALAEVARAPASLADRFTAAGRRVGHEPLAAAGAAPPLLGADLWRVDDAARVALLLADAKRDPEGALARASALYFAGDGRERIAVLRALAFLPPGDGALAAVRDALRANATDLFAAAICENPYAARWLPDELFFQAVLKCAFVGLALWRIADLEKRATPELARMLFAYVTERERAGRPVAADLWPVIALHPPEGAAERIRARLAGAANDDERKLLHVALRRVER